MDDDDDLVEVTFEVVEVYEREADAVEHARVLVERGIGATVEPIPADELDDDVPSAGYRIAVLPHELIRAQEALGLVEPEVRPDPSPVEPMKLEKQPLPWKTIGLIYLVAIFVLVPGAFWITYLIVSK